MRELSILGEAVNEIMERALDAFKNKDGDCARHIEPIEEVIDNMVETLRANHTRRLLDGQCSVLSGMSFLNALTNLERIADQCSNIGIFTLSLVDDAVGGSHHDYLHHLHQGEDELFNNEYSNAYEKYCGRLAAMSK